MIRLTDIRLPLGEPESSLEAKICKKLNIPAKELINWEIRRRSLDARKKRDMAYLYTVDVTVAKEKPLLKRGFSTPKEEAYVYPRVELMPKHRPVVVGFGPAGIFAGLLLARLGLKPLVLERGEDVDARTRTVEAFWRGGPFNPESNVQFGEGGAGAFSDGKLTARTKDLRSRFVLETLAEAGRLPELLVDNKPHIGTDKLKQVVKGIRQDILALGGEVRFGARVVDLQLEQNAVAGLMLTDGEFVPADRVILAVGHSARDTFEVLYQRGLAMAQKPFAMGVRIEHTQQMINLAQYGEWADMLPPADYRLAVTAANGRGVYTFCMCPGGEVVAAASERGRLTVNGMSYHDRAGKNANAALLVQVFPEDFGSSHPLAGMEWQRRLEEAAFQAGGGDFTAPVERLADFLGTEIRRTVEPTYRPGVKETDLTQILPPFMTEALRDGLTQMGRRLPGFDDGGAVLTAIESRSSSPVRLLRGETGESLNIAGLYPAGEGAGYAGGIVSAAIDGLRAAEQLVKGR